MLNGGLQRLNRRTLFAGWVLGFHVAAVLVFVASARATRVPPWAVVVAAGFGLAAVVMFIALYRRDIGRSPRNKGVVLVVGVALIALGSMALPVAADLTYRVTRMTRTDGTVVSVTTYTTYAAKGRPKTIYRSTLQITSRGSSVSALPAVVIVDRDRSVRPGDHLSLRVDPTGWHAARENTDVASIIFTGSLALIAEGFFVGFGLWSASVRRSRERGARSTS